MPIQDKIIIKVNPNSREYYNKLGYKCVNFEEIEIRTIDLPKGSNLKVNVSCDMCGSSHLLIFNKYYKNTKGLSEIYTCKKCSYVKVKKTKLEKYGNEKFQNIEKIKKTKLEKYGTEFFNNRKKSKETVMMRYGVDNISKCDHIKRKKEETNKKNWGVKNVFQSEDIKTIISNTVYGKYGVEFYLQSEDCKLKYKEFCKKIGVDHYSKTEEYRKKYEETSMLKWKFKTPLMHPDIKEKGRNTNIIKYGFPYPCQNKDISLSLAKIIIEKRNEFFKKIGYEMISYDYDLYIYKLKRIECGHEFETSYDLFRSRIKYSNNPCLVCHPKNDLSSIKEFELGEFIKSIYDDSIIINTREVIGKEIDIYLPGKKIAFEFNGLYWHSDVFKEKEYHVNKTISCNEKGISLIHIWEDDWINKNEIVKSIIRNKLEKNYNKIFSRKCLIKIISNKESNLFLDSNHIQGKINANLCLGLEYMGEIVSVMTFGKRKINGIENLELLRFCNKINTSVVGSASKLFKFFINNYNFKKIISYSDRSCFDGKLYEKLGFKNMGETSLNYYWTDLKNKYHRFNFNKKRLIKMGYDSNKTENSIMREIGFYKIWSCGQIRWIFEK